MRQFRRYWWSLISPRHGFHQLQSFLPNETGLLVHKMDTMVLKMRLGREGLGEQTYRLRVAVLKAPVSALEQN